MSDTSRLLSESVATFLRRSAKLDEVSFLSALEESGFALAMLPEESGGLSASFTEASIIARLWGAHAAPLPIVEMLLSGAFPLNPGEGGITIASATTRDGKIVAARVPDARYCVVAKSDGRGAMLARIGNADIWHTVADEPMLSIEPPTIPVPGSHELPAFEELLRQGSLLSAARILGAMERVIEIIIEHSTVRSQFGRPLAKFQLVQAMIADAASEVDASRAVLERALELLDQGMADELVWRSAKSQAGRAATVVASNAHQLLGAIGFTQEHELHNLTRRLWSWRDAWTRQSEAEEAVGALACAAGGQGLWRLIADASVSVEWRSI